MRKNLKVCASLIGLTLACNTLSVAPAASEALSKKGYIHKSDKEMCDVPCDEYVVQVGDTFLDIARRINDYYGNMEGSSNLNLDDETLSQLLIRMNMEILPINPNDVIYFPDTSLDSLNMISPVSENNTFVEVNRNNNKIALNSASLLNLLSEIYGKGGYIDKKFGEHVDKVNLEFATKYLEQLGLSDKYYLSNDESSIVLSPDNINGAYYDLTESIFLPSEMDHRIPLSRESVLNLLKEIYGKNGYMDERFGQSVESVDYAFAQDYLAQLGLNDKYRLSDGENTLDLNPDGSNDAYYDLTETLLTPEELESRIPLSSASVLDLLGEIYSENGYMQDRFGQSVDSVDIDFARQYLELLNLDDKYYITDSTNGIDLVSDGSNDAYFDLTETLYTPQELLKLQSQENQSISF